MKSLATPIACVALMLSVPACQTEPGLACEGVRFGWPLLELSPSVDSDLGAEGLQVDFDVRSDLESGIEATLTIAVDEEDPVFAGQAISQDDGLLSFRKVTVPEGEIVFFIAARDSCGGYRSGVRTFVWDGLGFPACSLRLASGPGQDPASPFPVLLAEHDEDPLSAGMQVKVLIEAGRPDMRVRLFATDLETGDDQSVDLTPDETGLAEHEMTIGEGEQALRAVCFWDAQGLRPSSPTWTYWVSSGE